MNNAKTALEKIQEYENSIRDYCQNELTRTNLPLTLRAAYEPYVRGAISTAELHAYLKSIEGLV